MASQNSTSGETLERISSRQRHPNHCLDIERMRNSKKSVGVNCLQVTSTINCTSTLRTITLLVIIRKISKWKGEESLPQVIFTFYGQRYDLIILLLKDKICMYLKGKSELIWRFLGSFSVFKRDRFWMRNMSFRWMLRKRLSFIQFSERDHFFEIQFEKQIL